MSTWETRRKWRRGRIDRSWLGAEAPHPFRDETAKWMGAPIFWGEERKGYPLRSRYGSLKRWTTGPSCSITMCPFGEIFKSASGA